jgi:hypothetical protein
MSIKMKVLIMASKLSTALMFGALVGLSASPLGITPVTAADLSVPQVEQGWFGKAKQIGGQIIENGKEKYSAIVDPDAETRQLRWKVAELERQLTMIKQQKVAEQTMVAVDYNMAMQCLKNLDELLRTYRPAVLMEVPVGNDRVLTADDFTNKAALQQPVEEVSNNGE